MAYRLSKEALNKAAHHLEEYGDTDVFPHLPELEFLKDRHDDIVEELSQLDLDSYVPGVAVEALAPKSRYGFRIVHQLQFVDTVLLLAATAEIGPKVEQARLPKNRPQAFSYRYVEEDGPEFFDRERTYKKWLMEQAEFLKMDMTIKTVVATDISDFYARISFHRLMDNSLEEAVPSHGAVRFIKKLIRSIRAKQSFGLPIGGAAARLLAELALHDTDKALELNGTRSTRFVDDFRLFLSSGEEPYDALAVLAEHLGVREGLSLNVDKTRIYSREAYLELLESQTSEVADEAGGEAFGELVAGLYFDEEPDPADLERLQNINLLGLLSAEVEKDVLDTGRVKLIFRALRVAKPPEAVDFMATNFDELLVFAREAVILMHILESEFSGCFDDLSQRVVDAVTSSLATSIQLVRTWLLDLFVRGTVPISVEQHRQLENSLSSLLDRRQLVLIRGMMQDRNYFGMNKAAYINQSLVERPCFVWGASCLPKDEFETWLGTIRPHETAPLANLYLQWAREHRTSLVSRLRYSHRDHSE